MRFAGKRRNRLAGLCLGAAVAGSFGVVTAMPAQAAEGRIRNADVQGAIAGEYIVALTEASTSDSGGVTAKATDLGTRYGGNVERTYEHALTGFSMSMSEDAARELAADPSVRYVEQNQRAHAFGTQDNPPSWGLDRMDQRDLPLNESYTYPNEAQGVTAYVIDTGVRTSHSTFEGRASSGYDFVDGDGTANDCNGHGTHVSGTIAGAEYGVAKRANIVGVRVLNCQGSGSYAGVIDGIDWVTQNASGPSVANMSLGGGASTAVDDAVRNSIASGITYGLAAGNSGADACNTSPARVGEGITVGATNRQDGQASYSNYGNCLDIYAPGTDITSAWIGSDSDTNTISGTSMATPHVVGAAALVLGNNASAAPQQVRATLVNNASSEKVSGIGVGSPNRLLHVGEESGKEPPEEPGNEAPAADFTVSCFNGCQFDASSTADPDGSIASYSWDFGDGATAGGATTSHGYSGGGEFTVTLTVTDDAGATDSATRALSCYDFGTIYCFA